ncbi:hypothetical protein HU200_004819 [Digitaria exilis]|uniref:Uncharacterized protein n=1 Tax=Digitaria exilis TaxID=1010633 RepID=A0A835FU95_9POAL|nr:hypothetical protein HU200_004819 [Digitaria exilis]
MAQNGGALFPDPSTRSKQTTTRASTPPSAATCDAQATGSREIAEAEAHAQNTKPQASGVAKQWSTGEEAATQKRATQAADSQDPAWQPRGADRRQEQGS